MNKEYNTPPLLVLPYEVLKDDRLTLRHVRVLMALFSWRKKNTGLARVSRQMLADRTGYLITQISTITTELEQLGWISKIDNGDDSQMIYEEIIGEILIPMDKRNKKNL